MARAQGHLSVEWGRAERGRAEVGGPNTRGLQRALQWSITQALGMVNPRPDLPVLWRFSRRPRTEMPHLPSFAQVCAALTGYVPSRPRPTFGGSDLAQPAVYRTLPGYFRPFQYI